MISISKCITFAILLILVATQANNSTEEKSTSVDLNDQNVALSENQSSLSNSTIKNETHHDHSKSHTFPTQCKQMLMESYDLNGQEHPVSEPNYICKGIISNCCSFQTQLNIYRKLNKKGEIQKINHFYSLFESVYNELFDLFSKVEIFARVSSVFASEYKNSNCLKMAKTIEKVSASQLKDQVLAFFKQSVDFYKMSYKGFYCTLCDAELHEYFDSDHSTFVESKDFCREMVRETLNFNIYRNNFFPKITRLYSQFVTSCDYRSVYDPSIGVPPDVMLFRRPKVQGPAEACMRGYNKQYGLLKCQEYCKLFNPIKFSPLLMGEFYQMNRLVSFIKRQLIRLKIKERKFKLRAEGKSDSSVGRILSDDFYSSHEEDDEQQDLIPSPERQDEDLDALSDFNRKYQTAILRPIVYKFKYDVTLKNQVDYHSPIFSFGVHKIEDLMNFRAIIKHDGINFHDNGINTDVDYVTGVRTFKAIYPDLDVSELENY